MTPNPTSTARRPLCLRVDDKSGSRKTPRFDIICPSCQTRLILWTNLPAAGGDTIIAPCPCCNTGVSAHIMLRTFDIRNAPPYFARILRGRGRADRRYHLTTSRDDRPRMTNHHESEATCPS
jgi:hypothetical protein